MPLRISCWSVGSRSRYQKRVKSYGMMTVYRSTRYMAVPRTAIFRVSRLRPEDAEAMGHQTRRRLDSLAT